MKKNNIVVLDVETGGKDCKVHQITQICMKVIDVKTFKTLSKYVAYIKPYANKEIDEKILAKTRVTMSDVLNGKESTVVLKEMISFLKEANPNSRASSKPIACGHNVTFDLDFIEEFFSVHKKDLYEFLDKIRIDTLGMSILFFRDLIEDEATSLKLEACCERLGITLDGAHDAEDDVDATTNLLKKITVAMTSGDTSTKKTGKAPQEEKEENTYRKNFSF
jgi:DNA polymerase III alpha subunit (gram-positive type)